MASAVSTSVDIAHLAGELDVRRKLFIAQGGPADLSSECIVVKDEGYDVEQSIFSVLDDRIKQYFADAAVKPYWSDAAVLRANREYDAKVTPPPQERLRLLEFMAEECNFKLEHADGSFMDHLTFCRDYCTQHYPQASATPLFIHSILGVGTNIFPMTADKLPALATLLTPDEMAHVEAFPSVLRLLGTYSLLDQLQELVDRGQKERLIRFSFHRLIDNERIELTVAQLWVQLNYHLIHAMDFLPIANWTDQAASIQQFAKLHHLLVTAGELAVNISYEVSGWSEAAGKHISLQDIVTGEGDVMEKGRAGGARFNTERSGAIGHSLEFELVTAPLPRL